MKILFPVAANEDFGWDIRRGRAVPAG